MKKTWIALLTVICSFWLAACQESMEDRCERECKTYTKKNCPMRIVDGITLDSMTFERDPHTVCYYYTLTGTVDNEQAIKTSNASKLLLEQVKNSAHLRIYKENGYRFRYVYRSSKQRGKKLLEAIITEKDYR